MQQEHEQDGNAENGEGKDDKPSNYRTRRCTRWAQGNCHLGEACTFLHSGEVGTHFPCRNFLNGFCPRGRLCDFKHDTAALPPFGGTPMMPFHPGVVIPPVKKNGAPCRHFEKGYCSLGIACSFQHAGAGSSANLPTNAKSTQCRHFEKGFCNLGEGCAFAHGDKEGSLKPVAAAGTSNTCRHYERGFCRLGQTCGFQHPGYAPPGLTAMAPFPQADNPYVNAYSQAGASAYSQAGSSFYPPFSPYGAPSLPPRQQFQPTAPVVRRPGTEVCRHWAKGFCQMDKKCGFLHTN